MISVTDFERIQYGFAKELLGCLVIYGDIGKAKY